MTGGALDILRLIADSVAVDNVRSDTRGRIEFAQDDNVTETIVLTDTEVITESAVLRTDSEALANLLTMNTASPLFEGDEDTSKFSDADSIGRYGEFPISMEGLVTQEARGSEPLARAMLIEYGNRIIGQRANLVNRLEAVAVDQRHLAKIIGAELDHIADVTFTPRKLTRDAHRNRPRSAPSATRSAPPSSP